MNIGIKTYLLSCTVVFIIHAVSSLQAQLLLYKKPSMQHLYCHKPFGNEYLPANIFQTEAPHLLRLKGMKMKYMPHTAPLAESDRFLKWQVRPSAYS